MGPFDGGFERVMVSPLFQVLTADLPRTHLFDDDRVFTLVAIPPDIVGFDEGVRPFGSDMLGLPRAGGSIVPFVFKCVDGEDVFLHDLEELN